MRVTPDLVTRLCSNIRAVARATVPVICPCPPSFNWESPSPTLCMQSTTDTHMAADIPFWYR
ncbi:hypothetical protein GCM10007079_13100 [Nocardiopsis terrae]|nr:hypothetical protein GCM10007079_13100 [Nocardiopsis terrae]